MASDQILKWTLLFLFPQLGVALWIKQARIRTHFEAWGMVLLHINGDFAIADWISYLFFFKARALPGNFCAKMIILLSLRQLFRNSSVFRDRWAIADRMFGYRKLILPKATRLPKPHSSSHQTDSVKYLRLVIDKRLTWNPNTDL